MFKGLDKHFNLQGNPTMANDKLEEVLKQIGSFSRGAEFVRADLHIHSFGACGSYDVTDSKMTPQNIVDAAVCENLGIISITDHNEIRNVEVALSHSNGKNVIVIPGVELTTSQGHLLTYFPSFDSLRQFFGKLSIPSDRHTCSETIEICLNRAQEYGGFGVAAHIDQMTGLESMMPRFDPFKEKVLLHEALLGLEISKIDNEFWYTGRDINVDRKRLWKLRADKMREGEEYELPRILGSDAHTFDSFGKNASGNKKLTRIKVDICSFNSLRIALMDSGARLRLEDLTPIDVPYFMGMALGGGFLNGEIFRFNKNLNCIIGGRGSGKSTALESLRAGSGNHTRDELIESEAGPDAINLIYQDQVGRMHSFFKSKSYQSVNLTDPTDGITRVPIESYGQGETAETIQHCDKDPAVLLEFLDRFTDLEKPHKDDFVLCEALLENQTEIERLKLDINTRPEIQKAKTNADAQVKLLKEKDASQIVSLEEKLARGRQFRNELITKLNELFKLHAAALSDSSVTELISSLDENQLVVGHDEYERVKTLMDQYAESIRQASENVDSISRQTIDAINKELKQWTTRENETQAKIDQIRKELEARGIRLDVAFIRKVVKDVADFASKLLELDSKEGHLKKIVDGRRKLLQRRNSIKSQMYVVRKAFAERINQSLKRTVVEYVITVRFKEGGLSSDFADIIQREMNWRTSQVPKAPLIAQWISPFQMIELVLKKDIAPLLAINDAEGRAIFSKSEAALILQVLSREKAVWAMERCSFEDRPAITVTKTMTGPGGKPLYKTMEFSKLSLGQQQAVLLSILLFSKSKDPLVIDQPEDNLDSEFIYKTFVKCLRTVKESRQVIVVTHNANIAVLGDAELILPLRASSEKAIIRERGSIDNEKTKELACTILEGSREAFAKRMKMYGY
jgi:hypothetical protein